MNVDAISDRREPICHCSKANCVGNVTETGIGGDKEAEVLGFSLEWNDWN